MGYYVAQVGELIIKPEYRKDIGHFLREEYDEVQNKELRDFIENYFLERNRDCFLFLKTKYWKHKEYKVEWTGKYETRYDEETGRFVYGVSYNRHSVGFGMDDFFTLLKRMSQEEIFEDHCTEEEIEDE